MVIFVVKGEGRSEKGEGGREKRRPARVSSGHGNAISIFTPANFVISAQADRHKPFSLPPSPFSRKGFTLIELLVVMAIIGLLLSIAAPRYFGHVDRAKENTLREDLAVMRDAIDKYHADLNHFPETLDDLVTGHYLKAIPVDPITGSRDTWVLQSPPDADDQGVYDVKSGANGKASDGSAFGEL